MLLYVACGFSGEAAALQQDRQWIRRSELHVLIPVIPIECLIAHDIPVLVGEPEKIVRDAVKDDVLYDLERISEYDVLVFLGAWIIRSRRPILVDPERLGMLLVVFESPVHDELQSTTFHPLAEDYGIPSAQ